MAVADILISGATLYKAPTGEALPSADSIEFGEAWGGNWINLGYTLTPVSLQHESDELEVEVEQVAAAVKRLRIKDSAMIETSLAELTGANINLPLDGTATTTAAGSSVRGKTVVEAGGKTAITEYAVGFEGFLKLDGTISLPVRCFLYKATIQMGGKLEFSKKAATGIPVQIKALADTSKVAGKQLLRIEIVTAKATGE